RICVNEKYRCFLMGSTAMPCTCRVGQAPPSISFGYAGEADAWGSGPGPGNTERTAKKTNPMAACFHFDLRICLTLWMCYFSRPASVRLSFICMYRNEISSFHIKNISRLFTSDGDSVKNS